MEEKVLTFVLRLGAAILTGGGLLTFTNGAWIGRLMISSFEQHTNTSILEKHLISDDLYREWGSEILFGAAPGAIGFSAFIYLVLILLLVGHVLYKAAVCEGHVPVFKAHGRLASLARALCGVYVKHYHLLTLALMLALGLVLFAAPTKEALVTRFLLFAVPVTLYLVYYVKDMRSSSFQERFLYFANLVLFCAAAFALPSVFGQHFFNIEMRQLPLKTDAGAGNTKYLASFVLNEERRVIGHFYWQNHLKIVLEHVQVVEAGISTESLRKLVTNTSAAMVAEPSAVASEIDRLLVDSKPPH